jgi:hypothetical protein
VLFLLIQSEAVEAGEKFFYLGDVVVPNGDLLPWPSGF